MRVCVCYTFAKGFSFIPFRRVMSSKALGKLPASQHLHPIVQDFTAQLAVLQPCFSIQSRDVRILSQPNDFYALLLDMIGRARKKIVLSSLYIGSSEKYLITALEDSLRLNPDLHLHLHLDYNRSTRPGPTSTASLLIPLTEAYPERVHTHLFKSPKLKGLMSKLMPRRFDEGWGTWHAKVYGADDEVLISGANLNDSYFKDRQDRYLHFKSHSLSEYCYSFLRTMEPYCFQLLPGSPYRLLWPTKSLHPEHIEIEAGKALQSLQNEYVKSSPVRLEEGSQRVNDVLIFPVIQAGQFEIREEERCLDLLFRHLDRHSTKNGKTPLVDLTSGYFSLSKSYQKLIQRSQTDCRVLCASPLANGFFGSSGISGRIPEAYTHFERQFWQGVYRARRVWKDGHGVQLHEWVRDGWTYHAKGLWVSPAHNLAGIGQLPVLTLFGSTNLNSRSANLDTELAFVMVVPSSEDEGAKTLRENLGKEVQLLREHAVPWKGLERKVRLGTKALIKLTAKAALTHVRKTRPFNLQTVNIRDAGQERWLRRYVYWIPALHLEGREVAKGRWGGERGAEGVGGVGQGTGQGNGNGQQKGQPQRRGAADVGQHMNSTPNGRCFNCGSTSHAVRSCPEPPNHALIALSRALFQFYRKSADADFDRFHSSEEWKMQRLRWLDEFNPGEVRGSLLRDALGLAEGDLGEDVPWLYNMLEWGYPSGWASVEDPKEHILGRIVHGERSDNEEDEMSDFVVFGDEGDMESLRLHQALIQVDKDVTSSQDHCSQSTESPPTSKHELRRWATYCTSLFSSTFLPIYTSRALPPLDNDSSNGANDVTNAARMSDPLSLANKGASDDAELYIGHPWRHPDAFSAFGPRSWAEAYTLVCARRSELTRARQCFEPNESKEETQEESMLPKTETETSSVNDSVQDEDMDMVMSDSD
ncbi:hypothetical protein EW145_g2782 [Phellinidium pouzarii]|uniref:CDP-diacylglycerol--glycerol-3-phosphate 1-phosphatidyltransferase n=1 Tax=Phellinidium pouzarii TaxID=167371 RepID=A0A4S4LA26_9AGAM|nr:hypothetical protein EW145_g2782 [Phellinidium pouzarii]